AAVRRYVRDRVVDRAGDIETVGGGDLVWVLHRRHDRGLAQRGGERGRIVGALIDDQIGDQARIRVEHEPGGWAGGGPRERRTAGAEEVRWDRVGDTQYGRGEPRERLVGLRERALAVHDAVVLAGNRAQAEGKLGGDRWLIGLSRLDLLQDEIEVDAVEM